MSSNVIVVIRNGNLNSASQFRNASIDVIDKTTGVKRTGRRYSIFRTRVPKLQDTVQSVRNIAPEYTGFVLSSSKVHGPGTVYWDTATTYEQPGTITNPAELIQVRRPPRGGLSTLRTKKWDTDVFYPKEGTSILKKRRFPLARTVKRLLRRPKAVNLRLAKAKSPALIKQDELRGIFAYLQSTWVPGYTPSSIVASRPVDTEYYPSNISSLPAACGRNTIGSTSPVLSIAEQQYKDNFCTTYTKFKVEFPPVSRFAETDDEEDY
jgi:hypothetical protein